MTPVEENIKVLIVEDELLIAQLIKMYLEERGHICLGIAISYEEALAHIEEAKPDVLLIDIRLYGENSGIDLAEDVSKKYSDLPFIFLTSQYDKRIVNQAVSTKPSGYLTKPIQKETLWTTIESAYVQNAIQDSQVSTIVVKDGDEAHKVVLNEIVRIEADHIYINIYLSNGKRINARDSLSQFMKQLPSNQFFQCHRSHVININKIDYYTSQMVNIKGVDIPVSRSRKHDLMKLLG